MFDSIHEQLDPARDQAKALLQREGNKPTIFSGDNFGTFFSQIPVVAKLIAEEPEILFFAIFQWGVIWLAYLAWVQMLHWIPDSLWEAVREESNKDDHGAFDLVNLVLLAWSFFIVCVASYPIGLCNAAMVAVHDLRTCGEKATLGRCLAIADQHLGRIWMFTAADAWITVDAILDRLPSKHHHRSARDELLYYAWKLATMGVVPALVNGRGLMEAGKDSLKMLTAQPKRALGLRMGYSAVCWVIGVLAYVSSIIVYMKFGDKGEGPHYIYHFYLLMAVPIFVAVGAVSVLVRPFFLLGVAKFYTDMIDVHAEVKKDIASIPRWTDLLLSWKMLLFLMMLVALLLAVFFGDQMGFVAWIGRLADKDLQVYYHR